MPDANRAFNLAWHDWMNLKSLISVSRAITAAALAREESRGAHFRSDFPDTGPLESSSFTSVRAAAAGLELVMKPVAFSRVRPGQSLLKDAA
jgi:fumarate reductase flavoprotein subunit